MVLVEEAYGEDMIARAQKALADLKHDAGVAKKRAKGPASHQRACALALALRQMVARTPK
jgi:hypothetical protein